MNSAIIGRIAFRLEPSFVTGVDSKMFISPTVQNVSTVNSNRAVDPKSSHTFDHSQMQLHKAQMKSTDETHHNYLEDCYNCKKVSILKRPSTKTENEDITKIICPKIPYHKRWEQYQKKRDEIFNVSALCVNLNRRSTLRIRKFYNLKKICRKLLVSTIVSNPTDMRYYAKVKLIQFDEFGLLDTGANISCLGTELSVHDFTKYPNFSRCKSHVKTADGQIQNVNGWIHFAINLKWAFNLIPSVIGSIDLIASNNGLNSIAEVKSFHQDCKIGQCHEKSLEDFYPLSMQQKTQLSSVIDLFPNFEKQGLGRTTLIKHHIDVCGATPIKQRFYPVSPAVEKLILGEIDRMLKLGVIEPSTSAWSSPMRLVVKPGKVRLCLDARMLNLVTKKDAYPLPNIEGIFARLPRANIISKLDLKDAFWQIGLDENSKPLTAFTVPGRPLYQFVIMPFGL